jgi:hypothetical protein
LHVYGVAVAPELAAQRRFDQHVIVFIVATSLEEAGDKLFTFTRLPVAQWKSARTTNAIERLHLEFMRRIKTQCMLPSAESTAMLFWALLASGQIVLRKVDGWATLAEPCTEPIDRAA